jgi:hypothetical protein
MSSEASTSQHFMILGISFSNYIAHDIYYHNENKFSVW